MNQKDLKQIKNIVKDSIESNNTVLKKELRLEFSEALAAQSKDLKAEMDKKDKELESKLRLEMQKQGKELRLEMQKQKKDIRLELGEMMEDIFNPQFEELNRRLDRDYIDKRTAEVRGDVVTYIKKGDKKVRKISKLLHKKKVITDREYQDLEKQEVFT